MNGVLWFRCQIILPQLVMASIRDLSRLYKGFDTVKEDQGVNIDRVEWRFVVLVSVILRIAISPPSSRSIPGASRSVVFCVVV